MEAEVERVKQEFEEKQKKKKEKEKEKDITKDKEKKDDETDEKKSEEKVAIFSQPSRSSTHILTSDQKKPEETTTPTPDEEPRVFALKKAFYQQRIDKKRNAEIAKRNRERLQNPNLFPQVPKGLP